jgi:hypothetical protein
MSTTLRQGFATGSDVVLDTATSVTVADTRIRGLFATGVGTFLITGTSTDPYGNIKGNKIKFVLTTACDASDIILPEGGLVMQGVVRVSAPTSASTVAVFYG